MDDEITQVVPSPLPEAGLVERRLFARLEAVGLADLIQLAACRPGRSSFRITGGGEIGELFLEQGRLHAARFGGATGLDALGRMLGLATGTFELAVRPWPEAGNVHLDATRALLRLEPPDAARAMGVGSSAPDPSTAVPSGGVSGSGASRRAPPDSLIRAVRTVDSLPLVGGIEAQHDPALARFALALHAAGRRLGVALGAGALNSARLTDERSILLLFHDVPAAQVSAVLGARPGQRPPVEQSGAEHFDPIDRHAVLAVFGSAADGGLHADPRVPWLGTSNLAEVARCGERLLWRARRAGFGRAGVLLCELLFLRQRLVLAHAQGASAGVLARGDTSVQALRALTSRLLPSRHARAGKSETPPVHHRGDD